MTSNHEQLKVAFAISNALKDSDPENARRNACAILSHYAFLCEKRGAVKLIERLEKKMGCLTLSGGSYGQLEPDGVEETRTISVKDWEKVKRELKEMKGEKP